MRSAKNAKELKDEILERLGAPIINIEVTESQIYRCIQRALELFGEYHFNGLHKTYKIFNIESDEQAKFGVFDLSNDNIFAITSVIRAGASNILTMDGNAAYPWVTDLILGLTKLGGGSCGCSVGANSFGNDLGYFTGLTQYWTQMQNMFNPIPDFWFNDSTGQLKLTGQFKKGDVVVVECYAKAYVDIQDSIRSYAGYGYAGQQNSWSVSGIYDDPSRANTGLVAGEDNSLKQGSYNNRWVKDYATTLVKEVWGQILAKHQGMQLPGGVSVDGLRLLEEARYEKETLRTELEGLDPPVGILIG